MNIVVEENGTIMLRPEKMVKYFIRKYKWVCVYACDVIIHQIVIIYVYEEKKCSR